MGAGGIPVGAGTSVFAVLRDLKANRWRLNGTRTQEAARDKEFNRRAVVSICLRSFDWRRAQNVFGRNVLVTGVLERRSDTIRVRTIIEAKS